jgi:CSLREA domain-containing protein
VPGALDTGKNGEKQMKAYLKPRTSLLLILSLVLACLLGVEPDPAYAATITIDTVTDEQDNHCDDGDCSLRDAINTAAAGDIITFAPGLSGQTITLTIGQLDVDKDLTIDGTSLDPQVQVSGNNAVRVFSIAAGVTVTLLHLDIISGNAAIDVYGGGGILNEGELTVTGCNITSNTTADNGGGIHNFGTLTVSGDSAVAGNSGDYGGGIRNDGTLTITDSTLSDNTANWGAGIDNYWGTAALDNTVLTSNIATYNGGGITTSAPLTVDYCTFTDNSAQSGGGIENHGVDADLIVSNSTFTGNKAAADGGALFNVEATAEIANTTFDKNSADSGGGGIFNHNAGTMVLTDSTLIGNTASGTNTGLGWGGGIFNYGELALNGGYLAGNTVHLHGGGIWNWDGELTIDGVTFENNSAEDNGGAIVNNWYGSLTVAGSTFNNNSADLGGAILNDNGSTLTLENSTLSANTAIYEGGGIFNTIGDAASTVEMSNVTFYGNSAGSGGGIYNAEECTLRYRNTIVANSASGGDCVNNGIISVNVNNLVQDGSCGAPLSGAPGLGPLANNGGPIETHALLPGSPAIDAGDATTCLATDQRSATRPADGDASGAAACDIGAFELGGLKCGIQAASEPADYLFLGSVNVRVTDDSPDLDCLRVTHVSSSHPKATEELSTGRYWQIEALSDHSTAASAGYMVDLTLFWGAADANDTVCRYAVPDWNCAAMSYLANTSVTRTGITQLSDWAVDCDMCTTAAVPEPGISLTGTKEDVLLSWTDATANIGGYQVYRSTAPYFAPGAGTLRATLPWETPSYIDTGAARIAGVHYSYIVRGLSNCGAPSDYDRRLGVFSFRLVPGQ